MKKEIEIIGNLLYFDNKISPINSLSQENNKLLKELINSCKNHIGYFEYRFIKMSLNDKFILMYFPKNNIIKKDHDGSEECKSILGKLDVLIDSIKNN